MTAGVEVLLLPLARRGVGEIVAGCKVLPRRGKGDIVPGCTDAVAWSVLTPVAVPADPVPLAGSTPPADVRCNGLGDAGRGCESSVSVRRLGASAAFDSNVVPPFVPALVTVWAVLDDSVPWEAAVVPVPPTRSGPLGVGSSTLMTMSPMLTRPTADPWTISNGGGVHSMPKPDG